MAQQQHAFPEIEGPEFVRSSELEAVAEKVLALHGGIGGVPRLHPIAEALRDGEFRIMYLFNEKPFNDQVEDDQEPEIAGRCIKAPRLWHDVTGVDFAIWARKHFWDDFNTELRRALVLHELLHIEVGRDKNNEIKLSTRKHDVEDFVDVARQYGPSALAGDGARYVRAAALFAGEPEPAIASRRATTRKPSPAQAAARPSSAQALKDLVNETGTTITVSTAEGSATITPDERAERLTCDGSNHVPGCIHFNAPAIGAPACGFEIPGGHPCTKAAGHVEAGDTVHDDLPF